MPARLENEIAAVASGWNVANPSRGACHCACGASGAVSTKVIGKNAARVSMS